MARGGAGWERAAGGEKICVKFLVERAFAGRGESSTLVGMRGLFRGRLIGRTPAFGAGYSGSSPDPGTNFLPYSSLPGNS